MQLWSVLCLTPLYALRHFQYFFAHADDLLDCQRLAVVHHSPFVADTSHGVELGEIVLLAFWGTNNENSKTEFICQTRSQSLIVTVVDDSDNNVTCNNTFITTTSQLQQGLITNKVNSLQLI